LPETIRKYHVFELAIFAVVVALVVVVVPPRMKAARIANNEAQAIQNLRLIQQQERLFQQACIVDQNGNAVGEYGLLGELTGEIIPRGAEHLLKEPYLPASFNTGGAMGEDGCAVVGGYVYRVYLTSHLGSMVLVPGLGLKNGPVHDSPEWAVDMSVVYGDDLTLGGDAHTPGLPLPQDENAVRLQEISCLVYAWPIAAGLTGNRAFVAYQNGQLYSTRMTSNVYSGRGKMGAANVPGRDAHAVAPSRDAPAERTNQWVVEK
jgi:hypothetical protein